MFGGVIMKLPKLLKLHRCDHPKEDLFFVKNIYDDSINPHNAKSIWFCQKCHSIVYKQYLYDIGKYSDGYHTFNELYHHRALLTAALFHAYKDKCWKSFYHHILDGPMYKGMFIVGIETPEGTATYHYDTDPYWFLFDIKELPRAPKWDGHTPEEAARRIQSLLKIN